MNIIKKILSFICLAISLPVNAASYTYSDSPVTDTSFPWIEIVPIPTGNSCSIPSGTTFLAGGNNTLSQVALPFQFRFGALTYTSAFFSSNGVIQFGSKSINTNSTSALSAVSNGFIGLFPIWNDMEAPSSLAYSSTNKTCPGMFYKTVGSAPNRVFTFQYNDIDVRRTPGTSTMQIQLHESSNVIVFNYKNVYLNGRESTTGIIVDNTITPDDLIQYSNNTSVLTAGKTLVFYPPTIIDHYEIEFSPDNQGLTCVPKNFIVRACSNSTSPCTNIIDQSSTASTITLNTSLGVLQNGTSSQSITLTGSANNSVSQTSAGTANLSIGGLVPFSCFVGSTLSSCAVNFNSVGLTVDWLSNKKLSPYEGVLDAGAVSSIAKISTDPACGAINANTTSNINLNLNYLDPATGSRSILITPTTSMGVDGTVYNVGSNAQTVPFEFDSTGSAYFKAQYLDAGKINLSLSIPSIDASGSANLISIPYTLKAYNTVTDVECQNGNVLTTSSTDKFCPAGETFNIKVRGYATDGITVLPNFGKESALSSLTVVGTLKSPVSGQIGNISNIIDGTSAPLSSGIIVSKNYMCDGADCYLLANLSWDNVGEINLTPIITGDNYFGAGAMTFKTSQAIGRFYPFGFKLNSSSLINRSDLGCTSSFTYINEKLSALVQLAAVNKYGSVTTNYNGSQMNVSNASTWNIKAKSGANALTNRLNFISGAGIWANGVIDASLGIKLERGTSPDGIFSNTNIGIAPVDIDGVQFNSYDTDFNNDAVEDGSLLGQTKFYFGRLKIFNNNGSDLIKLPIKLEAQYFNGVGFVTNGEDNCTTLSSTRFVASNFTRNLTANEISFTYPFKLIDGKQILMLNKPSGGDGIYNGTFDLSYNLVLDDKLYLLGSWTTPTYSENPRAKIALSRQKTKGKRIFYSDRF